MSRKKPKVQIGQVYRISEIYVKHIDTKSSPITVTYKKYEIEPVLAYVSGMKVCYEYQVKHGNMFNKKRLVFVTLKQAMMSKPLLVFEDELTEPVDEKVKIGYLKKKPVFVSTGTTVPEFRKKQVRSSPDRVKSKLTEEDWNKIRELRMYMSRKLGSDSFLKREHFIFLDSLKLSNVVPFGMFEDLLRQYTLSSIDEFYTRAIIILWVETWKERSKFIKAGKSKEMYDILFPFPFCGI